MVRSFGRRLRDSKLASMRPSLARQLLDDLTGADVALSASRALASAPRGRRLQAAASGAGASLLSLGRGEAQAVVRRIFYTVVIMVGVFVIHGTFAYLAVLAGRPLRGLLAFPRIELYMGMLLIPVMAISTGVLFTTASSPAILLGVVVLVVLPMPTVYLSCSVVWRTQVLSDPMDRQVYYEVVPGKEKADRATRRFGGALAWMGIGRDVPRGRWTARGAEGRAMLDKYAPIFLVFGGPPVMRVGASFEVDPFARRFQRGVLVPYEDAYTQAGARWAMWGYLKAFSMTIKTGVTLVFALLAGMAGRMNETARTALMVGVFALSFALTALIQPLISSVDQFFDSLGNLLELVTYAALLGLQVGLATIPDEPRRLAFGSGMGVALSVLMALTAASQLMGQWWAIRMLAAAIPRLVRACCPCLDRERKVRSIGRCRSCCAVCCNAAAVASPPSHACHSAQLAQLRNPRTHPHPHPHPTPSSAPWSLTRSPAAAPPRTLRSWPRSSPTAGPATPWAAPSRAGPCWACARGTSLSS